MTDYTISCKLSNETVYACYRGRFWHWNGSIWKESHLMTQKFERAKAADMKLTPQAFLTNGAEFAPLDEYEIDCAMLDALENAKPCKNAPIEPMEEHPTPSARCSDAATAAESQTAAFPRGLIDWEWYTEPNTARLFFHLLLTANWQEKQWQGITIHPGELVTSQSQLAKQLNLSIRNVRTALEHLQATGYVTVRTGAKYSVVSINNYNLLVGADRQSDSQATGNRQAADNNLTNITKKPLKQSSSARARETAGTRTTTHPAVDEFESCICKLSATSKAELMAYAERLGSELVSAVILKCSDLGGHSWAYVRKALAEAESQWCRSAEEYRLTNPIGAGRNKRVDRTEPSGNDWLKNATRRRPLIKKEAAKEDASDVSEP